MKNSKASNIIFLLIIICKFHINIVLAQSEKFNLNINQLQNVAPNINVTIIGGFPFIGVYSANANERIDQFIRRLLNADSIFRTDDKLSFSIRDIVIYKENGSQISINLRKFFIEGDYAHNLYLSNNDKIVFKKINIDNCYIQIEGAVKYPGRYEYVRGDKLSDAIYYAGGIDETYEGIDSVYIYRQNEQGEIDEIKRLNVKEDIELKNKDRIKVIYRADQRKDYRALIIGEVRRPGYVYIGKSRMKLREAIKESGGFTQDADLRSSVLIRSKGFFREMSEIEKRERWLDQYLIYRMARMSLEDSVYFSIDNMVRMNRAIASIDFEKVMIEGSEEGDFMLEDEDVIIIPRKSDKVYVFGQVNNPGFIKVKEKEDWRYYIEKGGGLGESASGEVYIIKNVSRSWHNVKEYKGEIKAGDMIWAAKKHTGILIFMLRELRRLLL